MIKSYNNIEPVIDKSCFIAENSSIIGDVIIKENSSIWYSAVLRGDVENITVGENTNIQDNSTIHTSDGNKTIIGNNVTIGHNAIIHGCTIKNNVLVGMGAIVLDGAIINENTIIAAGSLVSPGKTFETGTLVMGSPAKVVRKLTEDEIKSLKLSADKYVKKSRLHKNN